MRTLKNFLPFIMLGMTIVSFSACDGILDGIYDEEASDDTEESDETTTTGAEYGFISVNKSTNSGTLYIVSTDYYLWTLIDFHTLSIDSLEIDTSLEDPFDDSITDWDIAVHRYDARTNDGAAIETDYTELSELTEIPSGTYVSDEWTDETVYVDMSQMLDGIIGYSECYVNTELSKWIDVDLSNMPPVYTLSNKVYVVRFSDGTYCALKLSNYMKNGGSTKGYLTIDYIYPFEP